MEDELDSQSWQDRCERYFASLSDTGKDRDQEKHYRNGSENSREKRDHENMDDNDKVWKDLSEVRKRFSEYWLVRIVRKALSVLDIHGARVAGKTKGTPWVIFWMVIVLISVVTLGVLLFYIMTEYINQTPAYRIINMTSHKLDSSEISLTVCNLNLIRKSKLTDSELNDLKLFLDGVNQNERTAEKSSAKEVINANLQLKALLLNKFSDKLSDVFAYFDEDVVMQALTSSSDVPLLHRLSSYGKPELLKEVARVSKTLVERFGHKTNTTLAQCLIGNRLCQENDLHAKTDPVDGNCFSLSTRSNSGTIEMVLDAQSVEYIHQLSPSVGFTISLSDREDNVQDQWMLVSPGLHSVVSVNKLTKINRLGSSCDPAVISKKTCENRCFQSHVVRVCSCSLYGEDGNTHLCKMNLTSDYVCVKSLQLLQLEGNLPCHCKERCSEKKFDLKMTTVEWPSKQDMLQNARTLLPGLENFTSDYVRDNVARLTVYLTPATYEELQEYQSDKILDLLVRVGGLSALVAGVSVVTVVEIVFLVVQCTIRLIRYAKKRSDGVASPRRLSDSEITSITWAMYRQRRRLEEINKVKDKPANNNTGVNALGGNVQSRIFKRNSYATPENMDSNGDLMHKHIGSSNESPTRHNYLKRYDGKNPSYQSRNRESLTKEKSHGSDKHNDDINMYRTNTGDYRINVIRPQRQMDYIHDNRHVPLYTGSILHPNHGFQYVDKNAVERHRADNVYFYDGAAAYFNPANVSEPVYL